MLSLDLLAGTAAALFVSWLGLAAWIVGARAHHDRLVRRTALDAGRLADRTLDLRDCRWRLLWRLADGDCGAAAAAAAARELVRRDSSRLLRLAQARGFKRVHALRVLVRGGSPLGFDMLRSARAEGEPSVVAAVVAVAAELQTQPADELLLDVLRRGDHPRSRTATELAPRVPRLVERLLALVDHAEPEIRYWALMLLRNVASESSVQAAAVEASTDSEDTVRGAAARVIGAAGSRDAMPVLRTLLADRAFFVRSHAARAAGDIGADSLAVDVAALLADESWWVRAAAKESLLSLGESGFAAAQGMLDDEDRFARDGAAEVALAFERLAEHEDARGLEFLQQAAG